MNFNHLSLCAFLLLGFGILTSCESEDKIPKISGIPSDETASPNPIVNIDELNTTLPNFNYTTTTENGWNVIRIDMTGVQDPFTRDWMRLYGPAMSNKQNLWIEVDGQPKGFSISNTIEELNELPQPKVDLVFLVDNSTSMDDESDAIYRDIVDWSNQLSQTLDIRFACVGYGGFVSGAINFTDAETLKNYLETKDWRSSVYGVWRTRGFVGSDAQTLYEASLNSNYRVVGNSYEYTTRDDPDYNECGVMALRYANDFFTFRRGANRIYVNLTDEPNQPGNKEDLFSTEWVKNNWTAEQGTIHTVYTRSANWAESYQDYIGENYPWDLSVYTDGTMLFTNYNFYDSNGKAVHLSDLPVSGAMENSYIIRFTNVENIFDGRSHKVHFTVKSNSANGEIIADKVVNIIFEK